MSEYDFDKFLRNEALQEENRRQLEATKQVVHSDFHAMGIGRAYDPSPEISNQLAEQYAIEKIEEYIDDPKKAFEGISDVPSDKDELEQAIVRRAIYDAQIRNLEERSIVLNIVELRTAEMGGVGYEELTHAKKSFLANLMVEGWSLNDEMVQFYIRMAPGDTLDVNSDDDMEYLTTSLVAVPELEARGEYMMETIRYIAEVIYVNSDKEQIEAGEIAKTIAALGYSTMLAANRGDQRAAMARESGVAEICRNNGIFIDIGEEVNVATIIIDALDQRYPLTGQNS